MDSFDEPTRPAPGARQHVRQYRATNANRPHEIDLDDLRREGVVGLEKRTSLVPTRAVDENVDRTETVVHERKGGA
jgi:hypothetical protein